MKSIRTTLFITACLLWHSADASADSKQGGVMTHVPQQQPQQGQSPNTPATMTHVDPGQFTQDAKDVPQIDPGKVPSPGRHATPTAPPSAPPPGPDVTGFQTPDHLLDDMQRGRLPGDDARFRESVRELFGDADSIRDLPGMAGSEVDLRDQLGGSKDTLGDQLGGGGHGLEDAGLMPTPTTPRTSPQNTRGGPDRAPLGPRGPRDSMAGAAGQDVRVTVPSLTRHHTVPETGTEVTTTTYYDDAGDVIAVSQSSSHADGTLTSRHSTHDTRGNWVTRVRHYDTSTQLTDEVIIRTQDPYEGGGDPELTLWHARNLGRGLKDTGIQDPNRGPPPGGEDGAATAPRGSDFDLGDDVVINPDPVEATGARGGRLPRAIDQRSQIEQGHTPGGYTPE